MDHPVPTRLYHYCNLSSLRGIIEGKQLFMTNLLWMDDTTELFYLYDVALRQLDEVPIDVRNVLHDRFRLLMQDRSSDTGVFCTSFSEASDSRSQWLEYADDGHGFAVGFDPMAFELKRMRPERDIELKPVTYDIEEHERLADELVRSLKDSDNQLMTTMSLAAAYQNTWWHAARCKNPTFEGEKEWRLIRRDLPGSTLRFREKSGRELVPYIEFPLDPAKDPIREIWLGPRGQSQRNVDAIAQLLRVSSYDVGQVSFRGSAIPLRHEY